MTNRLIGNILQALQTSFNKGVILNAASEDNGLSPRKGTLIRSVRSGEKVDHIRNQIGIVLNTDGTGVTYAVFAYEGSRGEGACIVDFMSRDFVTVPTNQITDAMKKKFQLLSDTVVHQAAKSVLPTNTFSNTVPPFKYGSFVKKSGDNVIGVMIATVGAGLVHVVWMAQTMYISMTNAAHLQLAKVSDVGLLSASDYRRAASLSGFVCSKLARSFITSPSTQGLDIDNYIAPVAISVAEKRTFRDAQEESTRTKRRRDADAKKK